MTPNPPLQNIKGREYRVRDNKLYLVQPKENTLNSILLGIFFLVCCSGCVLYSVQLWR
jgi:hypothetical protein